MTAVPTAEFTVSLPLGGKGSIATPGLHGPNGITNTTNPTYKWSDVEGAAGYGLYLFSATDNGDSVVIPVSVTGESFTFPSAMLVPGATYFWWMVAFDSSGDVSAPSPLSSFNVSIPGSGIGTPSAISPNGVVTTYTPTFQWSAVSGATGYVLTVIDQTSNTLLLSVNPTTNSYTLGNPFAAQLVNGHTYQWFVTAQGIVNGGTVDGVASTLTFTLSVQSSGSLSAIAPTAGATVNTTQPQFQWSAVPGAVGYDLFVTDINVPSAPTPILVNGSTYTPSTPLVDGHTYSWQVQSLVLSNGVNVPGPVDTPQQFTIDAPATPMLLNPGGTVTTATPTFQWSMSQGAAGYSLYVEDTTTNSSVVTALRVTGTTYTLNAPLIEGHSYQWYVQAFDSSGDLSASPTPLTFTVAVTVGTPTPSGLSGTVNTASPTFHWSTVPAATGYYLTVQDTTKNTTVLNAFPVVGTSYTLGGQLVVGDTFQWSVAAFDNAGVLGQGTQPSIFSVYIASPALPSPTTAILGGTTSLTPTFTWAAVAGAVSYQVDVSDTTAGILSFVIFPETVTATSYTVSTPLMAGHTYEWQVLATDSSGNQSPWSSPVSFAAVSPPPGSPPPGSPPPASPPPGSSPSDELGAYRASNGSWSLDSDSTPGFNGATDQVFFSFSPAHVIGVAGDWTGSGTSKIGDFSNGTWHLDLNDNGVLDPSETFTFGQAGDQPVVGDWNGDGKTDIGVFRAAPDGITGEFILDTNEDHQLDAGDTTFTFGLATDRIVVGNWAGNGKDEVGVFRDAIAFNPADAGDAIFTLDTNNDHTFDAGDEVFVFGLITDGLIVGDWNGAGKSEVGVYRDASSVPVGNALYAPGTALFSLDTNGDLQFDSGDQVFLYGLDSDQFVSGHWAKTPPVQPNGLAQFAVEQGPGGVAPLTEAQLEPVLQQAFAAWAADGVSATQLESVQVEIGTLDDNLVGLTTGRQITLDATADGWGWNTDTSTADFTTGSADGLEATPGSVASGKMDLLTVVEHELGHELGLPDADSLSHPSELMAATLAPGIRRQPTTQDLDILFASWGGPHP